MGLPGKFVIYVFASFSISEVSNLTLYIQHTTLFYTRGMYKIEEPRSSVLLI